MKNIIYTVPHSGTHFIAKFLENHGMKQTVRAEDDSSTYYIAHAQYNKPKDFDGFFESKFIVTARDPMLTVKTELAITPPQGQQIMLDNFVKCWDTFIEMLPKIDYRMVSMNTTNKYEQLRNAGLHFGVSNDAITKQYATEWKIVNSKETQFDLIELDYSKIQNAVRWYNKFKN